MISIWIAFFVDLCLGDPERFPHPVRMIGRYIGCFEKQVRKYPLSRTGLRAAGVVLTISTVVLSYVAVWAVLSLCGKVNVWLYSIMNIVFLWTCISPRCLQKEAFKIYNTLKSGKLDLARKQLSYIVGRDTENLDESGVARAVVETVAENSSDGVIAPLLYMFIGGAPLAMAYKAINTLDSMVGYKRDFYLEFGWCSAKTDDLANYLPARISAFCLLLSALYLGLDFKNCWVTIKRDRRKHTSPNSAYPESAVAGAMGVRLGGVNAYCGQLVAKPVIGEALGEIGKEHIRMANRMMYVAAVLALAFFSGVSFLVRGLS